jgi:hypothetical protein
MGWVKEANEIGVYEGSHNGFRIYRVREVEVKERFEKREDGHYRITEFIPGWVVAVDKQGCRFESDNIHTLYYRIDIEIMQRFFDKRGW